MTIYRIALIPGDGIGKEVVPEGVRVLEAAARGTGISFAWEAFDWSCETFAKTGRMAPEDFLDRLAGFDHHEPHGAAAINQAQTSRGQSRAEARRQVEVLRFGRLG